MSAREPILIAEGLRFAYPNGAEVLAGLDLRAGEGELLCLLGPNGGGKTTLLRCLLGLLRPSAGRVCIDGRERSRMGTEALARIVSYVAQDARPAFPYTVRQIVMMGRTPHMGRLGLPGALDRRVVDAAMEMTGATAFADRDFDSLSGGERQTVMIARALAQQGRLMLLDEPTSSLDVRHQLDIYRLMAKLAHEWDMAVVCVSHDLNLAGRFADRLALLSAGVVAAEGPPAEVINAGVLRDIYGVDVRLVDVGLPAPMVVAL